MSTILDRLANGSPDDLSNRKRLTRDCLVELVGSALFIFAGTLSAVSTGSHLVAQGNVPVDVARILPIAVTFGVTILAMAFSIGHLSGCHLNPGVSLLMYLRGQLSFPKMGAYMVCQFLGGILGASLTWGCTAGVSDLDAVARPPFLLGSTTLHPDLSTASGFLIEFMGSLLFYFVIAQTALDQRGVANTPFPGLPIGLSLVVVHICLIPFTGCGVNPARTFGPAMVVCMSTYDDCSDSVGDWWWIYWAGPFAAAFVVAEMTNVLMWNVDEEEEGQGEGHKDDDTPPEAEGAKEDDC